ncbi:DUF551 domain-containing protein [Salmonella enterica]|uniref:DUF551 domain-containing protein n=1 Tax=Salmonella enterica TaxID=28901 RepID=UPI001EFC37E6|nr:DUF551 domain-containing protein [Salmonella enterica]
MTTITREQLHERARRKVKELEFAITQSAFTSIRDGLNEELELARIALASLYAEPVAWTSEGALAEVYCGETGVIGPKYIVGDVPPYRHAQPAPVVPEEMPKGLAGQIVSLLAHNIGDKFLAQKIWNACRAAMLQGAEPVSNHDELPVIGWLRSDYNSDDKRDSNAPLFMLGSNDPSDTWGVKYIPLSGNSPVIPDGWISCSERMPEDEQEVIVHNKLGYRYVSYFDEHSGLFFDMRGGNQMNCIEHILVTHWMPLPEPPLE